MLTHSLTAARSSPPPPPPGSLRMCAHAQKPRADERARGMNQTLSNSGQSIPPTLRMCALAQKARGDEPAWGDEPDVNTGKGQVE